VLYRLIPGSSGGGSYPPGIVVGFFDFRPDWTLTFTAGPPPEQSVISRVGRTGSVTTLWFSTLSEVGYRLRYTDNGIGMPISSWNIGAATIGDGTTLSLQDTSSTPGRFYTVEAYY
jgi:hypothetical protein